MSIRKIISGSFLFVVMMGNVLAQSEAEAEAEVQVEAETQADAGANDDNTPNEIKTRGWSGAMGISYIALDKDTADKQRIGDVAYSIDLSGSYSFSSRLTASAGFGAIKLDDKARFTQQVTVSDIFGSDVETRNSEATAARIFGEVHFIATPASSPVQLKVGAGYSTIAASDRSIDDCSDCLKQDIDLDGGAFASVSAAYKGFGYDRYNIGLTGAQYFSGDIKNTATIWVEYVF